MKKFTFLLSLLLAFVGVTASAQDAFKASNAPSNGNWDLTPSGIRCRLVEIICQPTILTIMAVF